MHPPFLHSVRELDERLLSASFSHSYKLAKGQASVLYLPAVRQPKTVVVFVPGNPGLLATYRPFLETLAASSQDLAVFAHGLLGHSKLVPLPPRTALGLDAQVDANVEFLDAVVSWAGQGTKIVLAGHSVGTWILCQVAKERPDNVDAFFFVTPTLSNILQTPNGRSLWWMFTPVWRFVLANISPVLIPFAGLMAPYILPKGARDGDPADYELMKEATRDFITSPGILTATLNLASDEMKQILEVDTEFLDRNRLKIFIFWARIDDWVGEHRRAVEEALGLNRDDPDGGRLIEGEEGIPHAFVFEHGRQVAAICRRWLEESVWRSDGQALAGPEVVQSEVTPKGLVEEAMM